MFTLFEVSELLAVSEGPKTPRLTTVVSEKLEVKLSKCKNQNWVNGWQDNAFEAV